MGRLGSETITADSAEVAYFCRPTPNTSNPTLYTLYRRQLLIIGGYPRTPFSSAGTIAFTKNWGASWRDFWKDFYTNYDLSARRELLENGTQVYVLNTLNDLQRRRNRFGHDPQFSGPSALDLCPLIPNHVDNVLALDVPRQDEDVLATNVLAFDVRLLDPEAKERQTGNTVRMQPGDRDYWTTITNLAHAPVELLLAAIAERQPRILPIDVATIPLCTAEVLSVFGPPVEGAVRMPDLRNLDAQIANDTLTALGITSIYVDLQTRDRIPDVFDNYQPNQVISTIPAQGDWILPGTSVVLGARAP